MSYSSMKQPWALSSRTFVLAAGLSLSLGAMPAAADQPQATASRPKPNPFLVQSDYALSHFNAAQTDSVPTPAPIGVHQIANPDARWVPGGFVNIGFQVFPKLADGSQYLLAANSQQVAKIRIDGDRFEVVDLLALPGNVGLVGNKVRDIASEFDRRQNETELLEYANTHYRKWIETHTVRGGVYNVMGVDGTLYIPYFNKILMVGSIDPKRVDSILEIKGEIDLSAIMGQAGALQDALLGMNMAYDGTLVFATLGGVLGAYKPGSKGSIQTIRFPGETITNSIAVGEDNGVYVVSSKHMRKVMWLGDRFSTAEADGGWESEYETTDKELGGVTLGTGSGSTPTLMGFGDDEDKLVVITDGNRVMNLVAFWRDKIPADSRPNPKYRSNRIAGQIKVTFGDPKRKAAQSEQSVAIDGYGALVVNNTTVAPPLPTMLENGLTSGVTRPAPLGIEKFEWDARGNRWKRAWVNVEAGNPSTVPVISTISKHVYFSQFKDGNWEISGLDWRTGAYNTRIILGPSQRYNGAWSLTHFFEDGDVGLGGLFGFIRIETSDFAGKGK